MAIFILSPTGFAWIWPYSSYPRRVLRENGHICPILGGFCVNMAIFIESSAGFAWKWPYSSNPRRVFGAFIQILRVTRREWIDRKGMQPQTYRVFDSMDKGKSNFWSVRVGAYCIRPQMYWADDSMDKRKSIFWSVRVGAYGIRPKTYRVDDSIDRGESNFWSVRVWAYCIRLRTYRVDDSIAHCHGHLWGVCNTPLHWYTKNGAFRVGGFNGESIFWSVRVWEYCIRPSVYRADDSFAHCCGYLWGVCNTPLHRDTKNRSFRVGCFNGKSNFWSVRVGAYCIRPKTYRVDDSIDKMESNFRSVRVGAYCIRPEMYRVFDSMDKWESIFWSVCVGAYCIRPKTYREDESFANCYGHLWGVCNTPLHRYTKNGSLRVGDFNGESIFWSVRVGAYCICPRTYRADNSMDKWESNFWSVCVGAYCIRPSTYRAGDSIVFRHTNFCRV